MVPAVRPEKFKSKSTATEFPLAVDPVDRNRRLPLPFWIPPLLLVVNVADETVVLTPSGIVPLVLTATDE